MTALSPGGAGLIDWRSAATGSQARVVKAPGSKQAFLPGIKSGRIAVSIVRCEKVCAFAGTDAAARAPIMTTDLSMRLPLKLPASPLYLKSTSGRRGGQCSDVLTSGLSRPHSWVTGVTGRGGSNGLRAHFTRATCSRSPPYRPAGCRSGSRPAARANRARAFRRRAEQPSPRPVVSARQRYRVVGSPVRRSPWGVVRC
jgi:hypothetical protein